MRFLRARPLNFAVLAVLVLTSQAMAVARGAPAAAGVIELCTGSGPVMVAVDETGAPVGPPRFCPEQALALLNCVAIAEAGVSRARGAVRSVVQTGAPQAGADLAPPAMARAPPGVA